MLIPVLLLTACGAADNFDDGQPDGALVQDISSKPDSHQKPTDHGEMDVNTTVQDKLTVQHGFHAWELTVHGAVTLTLRTGPQTPNGATVDTVV
jgi:hypothetical protein